MSKVKLLHTSELTNREFGLQISKLETLFLKKIEKKHSIEALFEIPTNLLRFKSITTSLTDALAVASTLNEQGIISSLTKDEKSSDEPYLNLFSAKATANLGNSGADFLDETSALWRCLAETYERHVWLDSNFYEDSIIFSSTNKLKRPALDITSLAGFSSVQKNSHPLMKISENVILGWINGRTISRNKKILCPAQLASAKYANLFAKNPNQTKAKEPMLRWVVTTGLATGQTLDEAIVKGILETLERDSFMRTFLGKISPDLIDMENWGEFDTDIKNLLSNFKRYGLKVHVALLQNDLDLYIPIVVILDDTNKGPAFSIGASADFDLKSAVTDAWAEAMACRLWLKKGFPFKNTKLKHPLGHVERMKYYSLPENLQDISFLWEGKFSNILPTVSIYDIKTTNRAKYYKEKRKSLAKLLSVNNFDGLYVQLKDKKFKNIPLSVVQVIIPNAFPMHLDERIPYHGESPDEVNHTPHPFP